MCMPCVRPCVPVLQGGQLELPPGWLDCPPFGKSPQASPGKELRVIPSKV